MVLRIFKVLIFLWPILAFIFLIGSNMSNRERVANQLGNPNGLFWESCNVKITVKVEQITSGEQSVYDITLTNNNGQILVKDKFRIDKDMFGGGSINTIQADDDPEMEILVWGHHEKNKSYLLDFSKGQVRKIGFNDLSKNIQNLADEWHQIHVLDSLTLIFISILMFGYYVLISTIGFFIKIVRSRRTQVEKTKSESLESIGV